MRLVRTITGGLSPKSVVGTPTGRFFAMNMMYAHTVTVYDRTFRRIRTISDRVRLSRYFRGARSARVHGAPAEGAVSTDGRSIYVSNYSMYGPGFAHPGFDRCRVSDRIDRSYVYRISVTSLQITDAIRVGEVPKYLATSPDGRYLLVGNWCSGDISVVDLQKGREVKRIYVGINPRGIVFSPDGRLAYVSVVGQREIAIIDMRGLRIIRTHHDIGRRPRHLVMSPDGLYLYVTDEGVDSTTRRDGQVMKIDLRTWHVVGRVTGLVEPRTTVIAPDGRSLYLVDYYPGRVVKIATDHMRVIQSMRIGHHPIGITYDAKTAHVWVAGYGGSLWVLKDR